ncbi:MAG: hypothetical protein IIA87_00695 [Nanoarchaeota archaeon]|nr:hypothetical protein [Nanoarchaeota archaeon]
MEKVIIIFVIILLLILGVVGYFLLTGSTNLEEISDVQEYIESEPRELNSLYETCEDPSNSTITKIPNLDGNYWEIVCTVGVSKELTAIINKKGEMLEGYPFISKNGKLFGNLAVIGPPFYVNAFTVSKNQITLEVVQAGEGDLELKNIEITNCGKKDFNKMMEPNINTEFTIVCENTLEGYFEANMTLKYNKLGSTTRPERISLGFIKSIVKG